MIVLFLVQGFYNSEEDRKSLSPCGASILVGKNTPKAKICQMVLNAMEINKAECENNPEGNKEASCEEEPFCILCSIADV